MKVSLLFLLALLASCLLALPLAVRADQIRQLDKLMKSKLSGTIPRSDLWAADGPLTSQVYVGPQRGLRAADKIGRLPGQPEGVDFDQYAGYVTVDPKAGRALFYYFVESPQNSSAKPLLLWLNGGPGCSSFGYGAMEELGPFRVNSNGKTLFRNPYAWNNVANVIFLESPAGVGFSYSNTSSDLFSSDDQKTARDSYTFLVNWLERFPHYKGRDFFIAGESYAGHYAPQLAYAILSENKKRNQSAINLKGIAMGNPWVDDNLCTKGMYDYYWTHGLNSDEANAGINRYCDFRAGNFSMKCKAYALQGYIETGLIDIYNIYAPNCNSSAPKSASPGSVNNFDPCSDDYVQSYLNRYEVQNALHVKSTDWEACSSLIEWKDSPETVLPIIQQLIASRIRVWIYSGDVDGRVPVTSSKYSINDLKLQIGTPFRAWYINNSEVGGYVVGYEGLVFTTVRGAGHLVPSSQPERALILISSFLRGELPPAYKIE